MPHPTTSSAYGIWKLNEIRDAIRGENWPTQVGSFYPLTINQSLRFNDNDSAYLSRTPASAGNRKAWTWSGWVKRGNLTNGALFHSPNTTSGTAHTWCQFANDTINFYDYTGSAYNFLRQSSIVLRDPSAWYHLVFVVDSENATAANRARVYVNGEEITDWSTTSTGSSGFSTAWNNNILHQISSQTGYFDGYLAEVHFTDGTAYTADDFGELKYGVWVAKTPSVTYGTNGFHLAFADSAAIGDDTSGNTNDWTPNNFAASDVVTDSPTNNFATLNVLKVVSSSFSLSEGNLAATSSTNYRSAQSTIKLNGKQYFEVLISGQNYIGVSLASQVDTDWGGSLSSGWVYHGGNGYLYYGSSQNIVYGDTFTDGDVISCAFDADTLDIEFFKNNVSQGVVDLGSYGANVSDDYFFHVGCNAASTKTVANFGQDSSFAGAKTAQGNTDGNNIGDFYYTPPTDYLALCTANLPAPAIDPAQQASPADYFNTVLRTGDGTSPKSFTGVGFQPDFVWSKRRGASIGSNFLFDVVRGVGRELLTNSTAAENLNSTNGYLSSFDSDGFTATSGSSSNNNLNANNETFVSWNWKANGTGVSNTDGTITSTVSANTTSGFSIVSFTANNTAGATVGHGLNQAPDVVIVKDRDSASGWGVYHSSLGGTKYLSLQTTTAATTNSGWWNNTDPDSSVFTLGTSLNYLTNAQIAYCFHSVEGFSKFGSYTGNGSANGPFVYTGFRPAFVIIKRTDATLNWGMHDAKRSPFNVVDDLLFADLSNAEQTGNTNWPADYLSNGFKVRNTTTNVSGGSYIYMAFAESPFKYANAR